MQIVCKLHAKCMRIFMHCGCIFACLYACEFACISDAIRMQKMHAKMHTKCMHIASWGSRGMRTCTEWVSANSKMFARKLIANRLSSIADQTRHLTHSTPVWHCFEELRRVLHRDPSLIARDIVFSVMWRRFYSFSKLSDTDSTT